MVEVRTRVRIVIRAGVRFRVMITLRVRVLVRVQASAWVTSRRRSRFRVSKVLGQSQGHG